MKPSFPEDANAYLKDRFGTPYKDNPMLKKLHTSMFATKCNSLSNQYSFSLINDKKKRQIRIGVYDYNTKELIDESVGYYYEVIETILKQKLHNLFCVGAERKYQGNTEYFYFNKAEIYSKPSLKAFLKLLDEGVIMYDIRIGSYKSGKDFGKPHDHGSGFRILEPNIKRLYNKKETID